MWSLKRAVQRYTKKMTKLGSRQIEGNASIYVITIMLMFFLIFFFKMMLNDQRLQVTKDTVDDALVASLMAASPVNMTEYGKSGQLVIYDDVTERPVVGIGVPVLTEEQKAQNLLNNTKLFLPASDSYLNGAYQKFENSLRVNLKLDGAMNATLSGINGEVAIEEFCIYNLFEYYNDSGIRLHYRFIRYTFDGSAWSVYAYPIDTSVSVYNSFDKSQTTLDSTTVSAKLTFTVRVAENNGFTGVGDVEQQVSYQRLVDVTD